MEKSFKDITSERSKNFYPFILENALVLKKDAKLLVAVNQSYSTATSLLVLSLEETIKSIMVFLHSEGYEVYESKKLSNLFNYHKTRHNIAGIVETAKGIYVLSERCQKAIAYNKSHPEEIAARKKDRKNITANEFMDTIWELVTPLFSYEITANFNDFKNYGLYVDYNTGLSIPKDRISKKEYDEVYKVLQSILKIYQLLRIVHNPLIAKREKNRAIYEDIKKTVIEIAQPNHIDKLFNSFNENNNSEDH